MTTTSLSLTELLTALGTPERVTALKGIRRGIERECLRITPEGTLAQTDHPRSLGSALTHANITTDYSESLLEEPALLSAEAVEARGGPAAVGRLAASACSCLAGELREPPDGRHRESGRRRQRPAALRALRAAARRAAPVARRPTAAQWSAEPPAAGVRVPKTSLQVPGLLVLKRNHAVVASPLGSTEPLSSAESALTSVGCAVADSLPELLAWRMLQAAGGAAGSVVVNALLRDAGSGEDVSASGLADEAGGHPLFIDELVRRRLTIGADAGSLQRGFAMAEWLAGSSVQQALSDAAQRTRFADPKLQELLRQEQDLGRELDVLYRYINQQASEAEPRQTPQINEQMRQRIARLSQQGQQLRLQLRQSFPQYEQMVRPRPPTTAPAR